MEDSIQIPDSTVHYWTYNPDKEPTIVMIHGFTGDHNGFQKIIPLLPDFRIIVPDLPGSGKSSITQKDWSVDAIARLANEFVKALDFKTPPYIFGHSMGGLVVASMIGQAPHLYHDKALLLSPVPSKVRFLDTRIIGAKLGELQYFIGHAVPVLGPKLVKSKWLTKRIANLLITTKDPAIIQFTYEQMWENLTRISSIKLYYVLERDINKRGAIDYAQELANKQLLIIGGSVDNVVPPKLLNELIKATNAMYAYIEGVGHDAHYERAREVAEHVRRFLKED
jgi:pimeloyl-ACP methyl ester carboxylesterase